MMAFALTPPKKKRRICEVPEEPTAATTGPLASSATPPPSDQDLSTAPTGVDSEYTDFGNGFASDSDEELVCKYYANGSHICYCAHGSCYDMVWMHAVRPAPELQIFEISDGSPELPTDAERQKQKVMRSAVRRATNYCPDYAKHVLRHLSPEIKLRFPSCCPHELDPEEQFRHCLFQIRQIKGGFPRLWYIGVTASPMFRYWTVSPHYKDYDNMFLLIVAKDSEITHRLEKRLVEYFKAWADTRLKNVDPNASGSLQGSPHFLYVCFTSAQACNAVTRRKWWATS